VYLYNLNITIFYFIEKKSSYPSSLQDLDEVVGAALEFYDERKLLQNNSLPLALEKDRDSRLTNSPLKFPGKLTIDVQNNRLFISDSNHNRIVSICSFTSRTYFSVSGQYGI
jgi:hypothetical protein